MNVLSKSLLPFTALLAALAASCGSSSAAPAPPREECTSPDPCGCVPPDPSQTCVADGPVCRCTSAGDAEPPDAGAPDGAPEAIAPSSAAFVGRWSPFSGTGQTVCAGALTPLPPDTTAVLTFTQDSASTLAATSSGAPDCSLELRVEGGVAELADPSQSCNVPGGGVVSFTTFQLTPTAAGTDDAGTQAATGNDDAGADLGSSDGDAGSPPSRDRLDWQLRDDDGTCTTTLHYTLVRAP